jgi:hypothetical protein
MHPREGKDLLDFDPHDSDDEIRDVEMPSVVAGGPDRELDDPRDRTRAFVSATNANEASIRSSKILNCRPDVNA